MLGIISFIVVIAGLVTGCLLMMRRHRKRTTLKDGEVNRSEADITLDKVYDDLLDFDSDDETPDKSNTEVTIVTAVMKLKGRSFWSINKGIILSGATIILFAVGVATVSVLGQMSYAERKVVEEKRMIELSKKLDSIDLHIKQMKSNTKKNNKTKSGRQ